MFVEKLLVAKPSALVRTVVLGIKSLPVELPGKRITSLPIRFNVIPRNDFPVTPLSEIETALASVTELELSFTFNVKLMLPPEEFCVEKYPCTAIDFPLPQVFGGTTTVITAVSVVVSEQLATVGDKETNIGGEGKFAICWNILKSFRFSRAYLVIQLITDFRTCRNFQDLQNRAAGNVPLGKPVLEKFETVYCRRYASVCG